MQTQAIHPDSFNDFRKIVLKANAPADSADQKEYYLAALANSDGWKTLKEYIETLKDDIDNLNKSMMERGASFEDIGRNAVIAQLARDLLRKIVQRVEDAHESVENQPKARK
jgi:hypothetical protein